MAAHSTIALITTLAVAGVRATSACEQPVAEVVAADAGATVTAAGSRFVEPVAVGAQLCAADVLTAPLGGNVVIRMHAGGHVHLPDGAILQFHPLVSDEGPLRTPLSAAFWRARSAPTRLAGTARLATAAVDSIAVPVAPAPVTRSGGSRGRP